MIFLMIWDAYLLINAVQIENVLHFFIVFRLFFMVLHFMFCLLPLKKKYLENILKSNEFEFVFLMFCVAFTLQRH